MEARSERKDGGTRTRDNLIRIARSMFGASGYAGTSIDDIVERAGVTKGAFYHHFDGKKGIFREVFSGVKKELSRAAFVTHEHHVPFAGARGGADRLQRFVNQTSAGVWRDLVRCCRRYVELHTDPAMRRIVLVDARWVLDWEERQGIESEYGVVLIRADLRRARSRGLIGALPLHTTAVLLAGALNEACLLVAHADDPDPELDEAMVVIERFLAGLRVQAFEDGVPGNR